MNRPKKTITFLVAFLTTVSGHGIAGNLDQIGTLPQSEFLKISSDLGAAASYKGVTPATPLGLSGFDIGVEMTQTQLENAGAFYRAGAGNFSEIYVPKIHIYKGLPFSIDLGAFASQISAVGGSLFGADLRYALLEEGVAAPALALRASGTRLTGISNLELSTLAVDAMLSKKLTIVTPYVGVGAVRTASKPSVAGLREETFNKSRVFVGVNANFLVANFAAEAEKLGDNTSLSAKVGFRF